MDHFFFEDPTVNGMIYLHMLENWLMPQLNEYSNDYIFQQDGSLAHYHKDVGGYLKSKLATKVDRTHRTR